MNELTSNTDVNLVAMSTEQLKQALASSIEMTAKHLIYMGMIWKELEARGEDLSALRQGIVAYIPMIAHDRLDARVVVQYAGQKTLLAALSRLPINEQRKVLDAGTVIAIRIEEGQTVEKPLSLANMTAADVHLVFTEEGVRPVEEQRILLASKIRRAIKKKKEKTYRTVRRATVQDGKFILGGVAIDAQKVVELLKQAGY